MNNLIKRALTGLVFVIVLVGSILLNQYTFGILFCFISVLSVVEFYSLMNKYQSVSISYISTSIASAFLFIASFLYTAGFVGIWIYLVYICYLIYMFISELYKKKNDPIKNLAYTLLGQIYVALPFALLNFIAFDNNYFDFSNTQTTYFPYMILSLFIFIWTNDTGAYVVGSLIGKHRLFERISPKKSWEGFWGGICLSMVAGYLFSFLLTEYTHLECILMGGFVSVFSTWGDLTESLLKRSIGVKDSGNVIPGHGGMLDRFDSVLLACPAYLIFLKLFELL